ncbi:MAG TPA: GNAT family N-acetyltransferase [Patescibacteria group bacterium]|nr:GNAT family N-acetyltransferase [Patescibacteria group bacterium]
MTAVRHGGSGGSGGADHGGGGAGADRDRGGAGVDHAIRPATVDDLETCARIWREALNDYLGRLAQPEIPDDLGPILRLYSHLRETDPATFVVAEPAARAGSGSASIDAFAVALRRDELWFLSMLFVRPKAQAKGLGRALLTAVAPDPTTWSGARATATDSVQPISNGLYASLGIVPRMPLLRIVGLPERPGAFDPLPPGIEAIAFDEIGGGPDGLGEAALAAEVAALDRATAGFSRDVDHPYHAREGRVGFLYRDRDGAAVGYGYTSEAGRVGPIAVRDGALLGPIVGHLVHAVRPRGAFGMWVPGSAGDALVPLLRAGFRIDGFPVLLCWDRPLADFTRYLPMSPGLL